jgi:hypothetical protein
MKRFSLFLSLVIAATALHAADNKDDLPPGLRKKDKLPPGIAKKRGAGEATTITTNVIVTNVTVTNVTITNLPGRATTVPTAPALRTAKVDLDRHVRAINTLDNRDTVRRAGLAAIAAETGITVATLQKQRRDHENIGSAGLLIGNAIAAKTKRPVANYFRQHVEGKSWERIAADNQVSLEELEAKLARVETAMRNAK